MYLFNYMYTVGNYMTCRWFYYDHHE